MRTLFVLSLLTLSTAAVDLASDLKDALTFQAAFDGTTDASVALGDKRLFVAPSYKEQSAARSGLSGGDVVLDPGGGRHGPGGHDGTRVLTDQWGQAHGGAGLRR